MVQWLSSERLRGVLVLVALAAAGVLAGRLAVLVLDARTPPAPEARPATVAPGTGWPTALSPTPPAPSGVAVRAASVLHAWDDARAAAYARGDPAALRRLYVPGSSAGLRDAKVLRAYAERGLVVRGLRTQVLALQVLASDPGRVKLKVTDRRSGGRAVGRGLRVLLPHDAPSTRVVVLRSGAVGEGKWRVVSVR